MAGSPDRQTESSAATRLLESNYVEVNLSKKTD